jgi:uncharacterized protein YlxW (UPF0749 family)
MNYSVTKLEGSQRVTSASLCMHVQLAKRQRLLDAKRRARRTHEAQLRAALDALTADEAHAQQLVAAAQQTLQDVRSEGFGC